MSALEAEAALLANLEFFTKSAKRLAFLLYKQKALCVFYRRNQMDILYQKTKRQLKEQKLNIKQLFSDRVNSERLKTKKCVKSYNKLVYQKRCLNLAIQNSKISFLKKVIKHRKRLVKKEIALKKPRIEKILKIFLSYKSVLKSLKTFTK